MNLRRILLWAEIEGAHFGKTQSFSNYDIIIESKFLKRSWTEVPYE